MSAESWSVTKCNNCYPCTCYMLFVLCGNVGGSLGWLNSLLTSVADGHTFSWPFSCFFLIKTRHESMQLRKWFGKVTERSRPDTSTVHLFILLGSRFKRRENLFRPPFKCSSEQTAHYWTRLYLVGLHWHAFRRESVWQLSWVIFTRRSGVVTPRQANARDYLFWIAIYFIRSEGRWAVHVHVGTVLLFFCRHVLREIL